MTITWTLPTPWNVVGPGSLIQWTSDYTPFPSSALWFFNASTNSDLTNPFVHMVKNVVFNGDGYLMFLPPPAGLPSYSANTDVQIADGTTAYVQAQLRQPTSPFTILDSGAQAVTWQNNANLQNLIIGWTSQIAPGGLTSDQAAQLSTAADNSTSILDGITATIHTATGDVEHTLQEFFSGTPLDRLTLEEVTRGPTSSPVSALVSLWYFGVIIRVTTIPDSVAPYTPDQNWYGPDLAVLRIFRGTDLVFREGIHTPTYEKMNPWQWGWQLLNLVPLLGVPPDTTVDVNWMNGCAGQVYLVTLP